MKFLIAVIQAYDSDRFLTAITQEGLRATKISSVGGFLRMGNATMFMAMPDDKVGVAMDVIRATCKGRVEVKALDSTEAEYLDWYTGGVHEVTVGGGVMFTTPHCQMYRIWPDRIEEV